GGRKCTRRRKPGGCLTRVERFLSSDGLLCKLAVGEFGSEGGGSLRGESRGSLHIRVGITDFDTEHIATAYHFDPTVAGLQVDRRFAIRGEQHKRPFFTVTTHPDPLVPFAIAEDPGFFLAPQFDLDGG